MTRQIVAFENKVTQDKRLIMPNALYVLEPQIPVTIDYSTDAIAGFAEEFQRSMIGEISFDIELKGSVEIDNKSPYLIVTDVQGLRKDGVWVIKEARIRQIGFSISVNAWGL